MSIRTYVSAIRATDVLPDVLSRPIAEYARHDDAHFIAELIGRCKRHDYRFTHGGIKTYLSIFSTSSLNRGKELQLRVEDRVIILVKDVTYDQLETAIIESRINSSFRSTIDNERINAGICHLHAKYRQAVEGEG